MSFNADFTSELEKHGPVTSRTLRAQEANRPVLFAPSFRFLFRGIHPCMSIPPGQCASLEEVRREIDSLDRRVIALLGERAGYVQAAARFKTTEQHVAAPERQAAMLRARREWAAEAGLDPGLIEEIYRRLVAYFIQRELEHWHK